MVATHSSPRWAICSFPSILAATAHDLGFAIKTNGQSEDRVRWWLKPWIVEAAFARFGERQLTPAEQREVWNVTRKPETIAWPHWWSERG